MKPVVFPDIPFPSPEFSQNPFESFGVHVRRQEQNELITRARKGYTIWVNGYLYVLQKSWEMGRRVWVKEERV
jgi:hypothetical protein